jgi:hypothetical protein
VQSDDFVGCVHSVTINGRSLNLSAPLSAHNVHPECNRGSNQCNGNLETNTIHSEQCGSGQCVDLWSHVGCNCDGLFSPDCLTSLEPVTISDGAFVEFTISDKHRRMHLLDFVYKGVTYWTSNSFERSKRYTDVANMNSNSVTTSMPGKTISLTFRTNRKDGLLLYAATNKDFTSLEVIIFLIWLYRGTWTLFCTSQSSYKKILTPTVCNFLLHEEFKRIRKFGNKTIFNIYSYKGSPCLKRISTSPHNG